VNVLVTGFSEVGVSTISQSLKQNKSENGWQILSHEISKDTQFPERLDLGAFYPELVIVVTNSTVDNVEESYAIVKLLKKQFPNAYKIAIANMQNLPNSLKPKYIEEFLGLTTYGREDSKHT
jgi:hypothetical protein